MPIPSLQQIQARMLAQASSAAAAANRPGSVPPGGKPGSAAAGKPPTAPGSAIQAAAAAAVRAAEAVPSKKGGAGRKRRASDLRLPDRGDLLVPDSPLFAQLQDSERRVDMLISRKKHELQEMYASFRRGEGRPLPQGPPSHRAAAGTAAARLGAGRELWCEQMRGEAGARRFTWSMKASSYPSGQRRSCQGTLATVPATLCHGPTPRSPTGLQAPRALRWQAAPCGASCASTSAPSTSTRWVLPLSLP